MLTDSAEAGKSVNNAILEVPKQGPESPKFEDDMNTRNPRIRPGRADHEYD